MILGVRTDTGYTMLMIDTCTGHRQLVDATLCIYSRGTQQRVPLRAIMLNKTKKSAITMQY